LVAFTGREAFMTDVIGKRIVATDGAINGDKLRA
jgi:hypothetical protein